MTLKIKPVLCRPNTMDNYAYIIIDEATGLSAVIDASEAEPVIRACSDLNIRPSYILTTHHHFDHVGGNTALKKEYGLKIGVPEAEKDLIEGVDFTLDDNETFWLGKTQLTALKAPGHTKGHNLYYAQDDGILFTGDVLFNLCIGGLFEGTPFQMWQSLQRIKDLPDDVLFYPGHEYTAHCLADLLRRTDTPPLELYAQTAENLLKQGKPVAPIRLGLEKQCNPYLQIQDFTSFEKLF